MRRDEHNSFAQRETTRRAHKTCECRVGVGSEEWVVYKKGEKCLKSVEVEVTFGARIGQCHLVCVY